MNLIPAIIVLIIFSLLVPVPSPAAGEPGSVPGHVGFGPSFVKDTIPDRMEQGRSYPVLITFKNSGLATWESRTYRVGLVYEGNLGEIVALPSFVEIPEQSTVPPGHEVSFALNLLPVAQPGTYSPSFSVVFRSAQGDQRVTEVREKKVTIVPTDGISSPLNGSIAVECFFENLDVSLDGVSKGNTPCIIPDLSPGRYEVVVQRSTFLRNIPVQVEKGCLSKVYIDNENAEPRIELKTAGFVSDGTLLEYIKVNVPLLVILSLFILACIAVMIHAVHLRSDEEREEKKGGKREFPGRRKNCDDDPRKQEQDLLDRYHNDPPVFEAETAVHDPGSGSSLSQMKIHEPLQKGLKNVRDFSREILDKNYPEVSPGSMISGSGPGIPPPGQAGRVEFAIRNFEVKHGFAKATIATRNGTPEPLSVEGYQVGPGSSADIEVEVEEPVTDEYELTVSLKVLFRHGVSFFHPIRLPYNRGVALLARGIREKAYEYYQDLVRKNPRHLDALIRKSQILLEWGLEAEAEAVINQVLAIDPNHAGGLAILDQITGKKTINEAKKASVLQKVKIPGFPEVLYDRYTPIRLLGKDPFASIILAIRNDTGDLRALKIAQEEIEVGSSLYTEISVLYQLRHINVLKMYRAEFYPVVFLELEYVSGIGYDGVLCRTLADMKPPLPSAVTYAMIEGIATGVAYLHAKGVRHYNLSPKYILLDEPRIPKISGLIHRSLILDGIEKEDGFIIRAPEQIDPEQYGKQGKRTDLFQVGVIWYWLMTGKLPYQQSSVHDMTFSAVYLLPGAVNPENAPYNPLLGRLLAPDKNDRYRSADEFLAELRGIHMINDTERDLRPEERG
jgi:tetratricopeptide (TPR) repeat protein